MLQGRLAWSGRELRENCGFVSEIVEDMLHKQAGPGVDLV